MFYKQQEWLRQRREEIGIYTQAELARRLELEGVEYAPASISHWETGRRRLPLENPVLRQALGRVLRLTEGQIWRRAGFETERTGRSEAAEIAADIIDELPPDKRELAVRLIEQLREG